MTTKSFEYYAVLVKQNPLMSGMVTTRWNVFADRQRTKQIGIFITNETPLVNGNNIVFFAQASLQANFGNFSSSFYSKVKNSFILPYSAPLFGATPSNVNSNGNFTATIIGTDKKTKQPIMTMVGKINNHVQVK